MSREDEETEILDRIEELEVLQHALQQTSEALALFLKPPHIIKKETTQ